VASRRFGWAGFQMLRFASMTVGLGMSDFAGLRSGGILDASRWHDGLVWRAERKRACVNPNSRFIMSYALVSGSLPNLWVMLSELRGASPACVIRERNEG